MKKKLFVIVALVFVVCLIGVWVGRRNNNDDEIAKAMAQLEIDYQIYYSEIFAALNTDYVLDNAVDDMRDKIDLARSLFNQKLSEYYTSVNEPFYHCYELCLIPDFAEGEQPSWDEASRWLCSFAEYDSWTAADLQAVADALLPDYTVPREDSAYLEYDPQNDSFAVLNWDVPPAGEYYQFDQVIQFAEFNQNYLNPHWKIISELGCYIYKWDEMWYAGQGENSAALRAYARHFGYTEENMPKMDVLAALQALLSGEYVKDEFGKVLRLKPEEELRPSEKLRVTFRLSGDKNLPFTYLSAEREAIEQS